MLDSTKIKLLSYGFLTLSLMICAWGVAGWVNWAIEPLITVIIFFGGSIFFYVESEKLKKEEKASFGGKGT